MGKKSRRSARTARRIQGSNARDLAPIWTSLALFAALAAALVLAYYPSLHGGWLWDDDHHLTRPELQSAHGLWRIWFDLGATQQYYPLTHSAFWLFYQMWGYDTLGYHWVNILLHALSALLVVLILKRLEVPWPWLAAAIFAFHPLQVESVAWMTELKNTLSGVLYFLAALAYLKFDRERDRRSYGFALAFFGLALLSKSVTATLPAALLVVFWWLRGRLDWRKDVVPLIPFFTLGITGGLVTSWIERTMIGAQGVEYQLSMMQRLLLSGRVVWFYLGKLLWPSNLIFIYPRWQIEPGVFFQYLPTAAIILVFVVLWLFRKRRRGPLAAMLYFCGTLFPALGFLNVYPFRYSFVADHFQYLAGIGVIVLLVSCLARLAERCQMTHPRMPMAAMLVIAMPLAALTWRQSCLYADGELIYRDTLFRNPSCWMAHNNLGMILQSTGRIQEAAEHYQAALRIQPDLPEARCNLGNMLERMGRNEEAVAEYEESLKLKPDFIEAMSNLGIALQKLGRMDEAIARYREALGLKPNFAIGHNNLAFALLNVGRLKEAIAEYEAALRIAPDYAEARNGIERARVLLAKGEKMP
jgi:Tfp pilus assembly protein PilF